jgi:radical SAM superfamily enzyme YgiQ (UPF0313 family)
MAHADTRTQILETFGAAPATAAEILAGEGNGYERVALPPGLCFPLDDEPFVPVVRLMARSGCIAVTGGLEIASDRLLKLVNKGVTVAQVARVTKAFTDAGVGVHAYLMYGFPTQTDTNRMIEAGLFG